MRHYWRSIGAPLLLMKAMVAVEGDGTMAAVAPHQHHPMSRAASRQLQTPNSSSNDASSQALKQQLLENYDRSIFLFEQHWESLNSTLRRGLDVELGINFHRVQNVDVTTSVADLIVWVRQRWKDPRLAWNESQHNVSTLHFWVGEGSGSGGEMSQIWTPDLQLWNLDAPISTTLADSYAIVSPDGTVFWSRPGHIKPVCKFEGLDDFPFDTLDCTMEIGSWSYSGLYIRPIKMDEGFSIGGSETAGESYAEFSLTHVSAEEHIYPPYQAAPEEDWPVIFYHFTFKRAWEPYARGFLTLQIILNLAAFCCLWLPPHIGERMSLSITSVVAAVASELVIASQIPAAGEQTWFSKFCTVSLLFTALVLCESAAIIYFYYHAGDDLKPRWYQWIERNLKESNESKRLQMEKGRGTIRFSISEPNEAAPARISQDDKKPVDDSVPVDTEVGSDVDANICDTAHDESEFEGGSNSSFHAGRPEEKSCEGDHDDDHDVGHDDGPEDCNRNFRRVSRIASFRTRERIKTILGRDADDFKNIKEMENNVRWQRVAHDIDDWARVLFPVAFVVFLASTFTNLNI